MPGCADNKLVELSVVEFVSLCALYAYDISKKSEGSRGSVMLCF